jgi:SulP family sulfate permease
MDQSGLYAMEDVVQELNKNGVTVLMVNLLKQPRYMMERIDIIPDLIPNEHIFNGFKECLIWIKGNVKDHQEVLKQN